MFQQVIQDTRVDNPDTTIIIQSGLAVIRGFTKDDMDIFVALRLGQFLKNRAESCNHPDQRGHLMKRAVALYEASLHTMRIETESAQYMFKYNIGNDVDELYQERSTLLEEAIQFLSNQYFSTDDFEKCIEILTNIDIPIAYKLISEAHSKMAETSNSEIEQIEENCDLIEEYVSHEEFDCNTMYVGIVDEPRNHSMDDEMDFEQIVESDFANVNCIQLDELELLAEQIDENGDGTEEYDCNIHTIDDVEIVDEPQIHSMDENEVNEMDFEQIDESSEKMSESNLFEMQENEEVLPKKSGFFQCAEMGCDFTSNYKWNYNRHKKAKHGQKYKDGNIRVKKYICPICFTISMNLRNFQQHVDLKHFPQLALSNENRLQPIIKKFKM